MFLTAIEHLLEKNGCYGFIKREAGSFLTEQDHAHIKGYAVADNTRLPESYSRAADSILITDREKKHVLGGVLLVKDPSLFRTTQLTNKEITYPPGTMEMNGLWLRPDVPPGIRIGFWALVCDHLVHQKGFVCFSYDVKKKGLAAFYGSLPGETIYDGPVKAIDGMAGESVERIVLMDISAFRVHAEHLFLLRLLKAIGG